MKHAGLISTIAEHPDWTLHQLAERFGVTRQAVHSMLGTLREKGIDPGYVTKVHQGPVQACGIRHAANGTRSVYCEACGWFSLTREQTFWARINFEGECWLWEGPTRPIGYGVLGADYTHRLAFEYHFGPIPSGLYVLHTCDVKSCARPDHLRAGTQAENINGNPARNLKPRRKPRRRVT